MKMHINKSDYSNILQLSWHWRVWRCQWVIRHKW